MIQAKCIQKFRDKNNHICGYKLRDINGQTQDISSQNLKQAITNGQIHVVNLTLTKDNRLVDTTEHHLQNKQICQESVISVKQQLIDIVIQMKLSGLPIKKIPTACGKNCFMLSASETNNLIFIPDNVIKLNQNYKKLTFTNHIKGLQGKLTVMGGSGIEDMNCMFYDCKAKFLELDCLDTRKVKNMVYMFDSCKAILLDLSSFDTSKVKNMHGMFGDCEAEYINLASFNTSKVEDMSNMFESCFAQSLDLSSFNTSKVKDMGSMFADCFAQSLDLSSFNTSKVEDMSNMFGGCLVQSLDLSSFDTSNVKSMNGMFCECEAQSIDLSSFNTSNIEDMFGMFFDCEAKIKTKDKKVLREYKSSKEVKQCLE